MSARLRCSRTTGRWCPAAAASTSNSDEIVRRFFATHPDQYEQVFLNFSFPMEPGAGFAFESNIANDVQGIGLPIYDGGAAYGTVNLASYLNMNDLGEFSGLPAGPGLRPLELLRAQPRLDDGTGSPARRSSPGARADPARRAAPRAPLRPVPRDRGHRGTYLARDRHLRRA